MLSRVVLVLSGLMAVVLSAPAEKEPVPILTQSSDSQPDGTYKFAFESADGTKQEQSGQPKPIDKDEVAETVQGSASWKDLEGNFHDLQYTADENGYQAQGSDVPKIPLAIARSLEWNAAHPEPEHQKQ